MKKQTLVKMTAMLALFFFASMNMLAQPGTFKFKNATGTALTVDVWADYDDCAGTALCNTGPVVVAAGTTHVFTGFCTVNGAWKFVKVSDGCGGVVVGYCGFPSSASFTDCAGNPITANWVDEHGAFAN